MHRARRKTEGNVVPGHGPPRMPESRLGGCRAQAVHEDDVLHLQLVEIGPAMRHFREILLAGPFREPQIRLQQGCQDLELGKVIHGRHEAVPDQTPPVEASAHGAKGACHPGIGSLLPENLVLLRRQGVQEVARGQQRIVQISEHQRHRLGQQAARYVAPSLHADSVAELPALVHVRGIGRFARPPMEPQWCRGDRRLGVPNRAKDPARTTVRGHSARW